MEGRKEGRKEGRIRRKEVSQRTCVCFNLDEFCFDGINIEWNGGAVHDHDNLPLSLRMP